MLRDIEGRSWVGIPAMLNLASLILWQRLFLGELILKLELCCKRSVGRVVRLYARLSPYHERMSLSSITSRYCICRSGF